MQKTKDCENQIYGETMKKKWAQAVAGDTSVPVTQDAMKQAQDVDEGSILGLSVMVIVCARRDQNKWRTERMIDCNGGSN